MVDGATVALTIGTTGMLSIFCFVRDRRVHCLPMSGCAVLLGVAGMLVGARLDFGPAGVATLADLCSTLRPVSLASMRDQAVLAPWTSLGMLGGCNLGMVVSWIALDRSSEADSVRWPHLVACNVGMILGAVVAEAVLPVATPVAAGMPASIRMLLVVVTGMTTGMWLGWWCAEWMLRGWRRLASSGVSTV